MNRIETIKPVFKTGNSLVVSLTKELRMLEIEHGDKIHITIEKVE